MLLLDLAGRPIIGHRGAPRYAPENTLESFRVALARGAEALELDVRTSREGEAVVLHDATLDRTTDLSGPVRLYTTAELARADAGYRFTPDRGRTRPYRGRGVRIPTLREVLRAFPDTPLIVEVKDIAVQEDVARALIEADATQRVIVSGEDWRALRAFEHEPFRRGAARREIAQFYFGGLLGLAPRAPPYCNLSVPIRFRGLPVPTRRFVRQARERGITVHVWTVDQPATALALWRRGVNGILTNAPDRIRSVREALGR
jgi:glycerophosphoryl diester phosphodiesterase